MIFGDNHCAHHRISEHALPAVPVCRARQIVVIVEVSNFKVYHVASSNAALSAGISSIYATEAWRGSTACYTVSHIWTGGYVAGWDWLITLADEIRLARRVGTLIFPIALLALHMALVSNCARLSLFRSIITVLATSFSSFLFFARVRAVYENSRSVTVFFGSFWLAIVGTGLVFLSAAQTSNIAGTKRCAIISAKPWAMSILWVKATFDTAVLVAFTLRLVSNSCLGKALSATPHEERTNHEPNAEAVKQARVNVRTSASVVQ
ncbi:hypothetical protein FIBSPDRAFT_883688 [Athelia psychrophila]|uniref:Uncharacterized protein n=1 Tax=Athelia psychrophila TaxID=1759441 RepID=A0A166TTZ5_9AGAM|nr:hypothetical protein FIBSPDRAFT_883688 [Fibularhizoctonia sp. CBS 109695]